MQQSNAIFGALFIAFVIFITLRGKLRTYLGLLLSSPSNSSNNSLIRAASSLAGPLNAGTGLPPLTPFSGN